MRIQFASDLHLERMRDIPFGSQYFMANIFTPDDQRDLLVLAGDIGVDMGAKRFVLAELARSPVIYVPGNHEYYTSRDREAVDEEWRMLAQQYEPLHYLVGDGVVIDGVRFWGAPWYSNLWGTDDPWYMWLIRNSISDFLTGFNGGGWDVGKHIESHIRQTEMMRAIAGDVDVIVTHWPPSKGAIHPIYEGDRLNPYFINDREDVVEDMGAKVWISGHTHEAYDYTCYGTLCVGNASGYADVCGSRQSDVFRVNRVVEI